MLYINKNDVTKFSLVWLKIAIRGYPDIRGYPVNNCSENLKSTMKDFL